MRMRRSFPGKPVSGGSLVPEIPRLRKACLGDFQERVSTGSCSAYACVDLPPAGGGQLGSETSSDREVTRSLPTPFPLQPWRDGVGAGAERPLPPAGGRQWP